MLPARVITTKKKTVGRIECKLYRSTVKIRGKFMFIHGKTGEKIYSVREKIKHYSKIAFNDKTATPTQKKHALQRLDELKTIDNALYNEPTMIVTDDKHFGNKMSKPRACVVVGQDNKKRLLACPIHKRTAKTVILENDTSRQVEGTTKPLDRSDVYETKYISGLATLTNSDKKRLQAIHCKK